MALRKRSELFFKCNFFDRRVVLIYGYDRAAEYLVRTGPIVTLEVAKQGAIYHGLATLLSQPSPVMTRGKIGV